MCICLVADDARSPSPAEKGVAWQDSDGFHLCFTAAHRLYRRVTKPIVFGVHSQFHTGDTSQGLREWLESLGKVKNIREHRLPLNHYHPRIYRPGPADLTPQDAAQQSAVAVSILADRLEGLFRIVEPYRDNLQVFGHEIRNLLLLACMEVEAGLAAVLSANDYPGDRFTTNDYVKLRDPLYLTQFEFRLPFYPAIQPVRPFAKWSEAKPTQSLPWYDAYNQTKHDREGHFHTATLQHAIEAVCAAVALFFAQFGTIGHYQPNLQLVSASRLPDFPLEEIYFWRIKDHEVVPAPNTWVAVNFPLPA